MHLFFGEDSFDLPECSETSQIRPNPVEFSESERDSNSGDDRTASSPTQPDTYTLEVVPPVDLRAIENFTRLADNALGLVFPPFHMHAGQVSAVIAPTPQAESLRAAPSKHQDIPDCEQLSQKLHAPREYATSQSHATANNALVAGCPQDTCLRGTENNVSRSEKAYSHGRTSKPRKDLGPDDWREPKERADPDDTPFERVACTESVEESDKKLLRAPLMRPVALPSIEETGDTESEELLCSGPGIGWYSGTFDGALKTVIPEHLNFTLPVSFPVGEGLIPGKRLNPSESDE